MSHHYESSKAGAKENHGGAKPAGRQIHRTWWFWLAVILMLGAMIIYGLS